MCCFAPVTRLPPLIRIMMTNSTLRGKYPVSPISSYLEKQTSMMDDRQTGSNTEYALQSHQESIAQ
jgi:hypothetical protein